LLLKENTGTWVKHQENWRRLRGRKTRQGGGRTGMRHGWWREKTGREKISVLAHIFT
jgi:hypothetical protein